MAKDVKQEVPKAVRGREKGYTTEEATKIIAASLAHMPAAPGSPGIPESPYTTAIRNWVPILCAHSGARVGEIGQLRAEDFREELGQLIMRLTPEAGTIKSGQYRDVPVHPQIVELGFNAFLNGKSGPLFYEPHSGRTEARAAKLAGEVLRKWLNLNQLNVDGVAPNHGWRHRFKTVGRELEIPDLTLDAITGHAATTVGARYGDVTLQTKINAILKMPYYAVQPVRLLPKVS